jgi:cobalt/nickel transport system permease protein
MHHAYLDKFAARDSPVHRRDPRAKTLAFLGLLVAAILVPAGLWWPFAAVAAVLLALWAASRVPAGYLLKRVLVLSPFIAASLVLFPFLYGGDVLWSASLGPWTLTVTRQGLELAGNLAAKFALAVLILGLLFSVTRFQHFLYALRRCRVPQLLVMQLGFLYRYLFVIHDEVERLLRARDARSGGRGRRHVWRATAGLVGVLFLRSFQRSERLYWAMLARGFAGEALLLDRLRFRPADAAFVAVVLAAAAATTAAWIVLGRPA